MITTSQEQTRAAWNKIAENYDKTITPSHMWLGKEGLNRVGLRPDMRFLDVASGSGALSIPAARLGAKVVSVDISSAMLELLEKRAHKEGLNVETRVMDGHELEFKNDTFDICGSQFGVMLFPDMPRALREMVRVTKPGGRVLMNVFGSVRKVEFFVFFMHAIQVAVPEFSPPLDPPPLPFQLQDPKKLSEELSKAGLKDIHVEEITEKLEFQSGDQFWFWLINSNPVAQSVLSELNLTEEQMSVIRRTIDQLVKERSRESSTAVLTCQINIGIGTK